MQKNFLSIADISRDEILELLEVANTQKKRVTSEILKGKNIALLFEKESLRTKASFETGIHELGGNVSYFSAIESGRLGERESVEDQARSMSRFFDAIVARVSDHVALEKFASASSSPVINALTNRENPCQILADLLTIKERLGRLNDFKMVFLGNGNNIALSLAIASEIMGFEFVLAGPKKYFLPYNQINQTEDIDSALQDADVVYTDIWGNNTDKKEEAEKFTAFLPYQLNRENLDKAKKDAIVLHCLPAHRGNEITSDVMDSTQSAVFDQSENRLAAQKALLIKIFLNLNTETHQNVWQIS
ncbi:MAG: ornithine carbamoyltransferase [Candidatus Gracilibacteria bacterium]|jgi:ornithine carbamoyltransferase|nr:ornithine carbamoyltransferase [Candidatus Gracilibacteria bacterium]MDD5179064.1 ornithine carbamoyltransferase [Candidatus Gracilibacteria bacterium]